MASSRRIRRCADELKLCSNGRFRPKWACGVRLCPSCYGQHWRQRRSYTSHLQSLIKPDIRVVNVTLTDKSVPVQCLRRQIDHLHKAFQRLTRRKLLQSGIGHARATEVVVNSDLTAHPHIHAQFVLTDPTAELRWTGWWQESLGVHYFPSTHESEKNPMGWAEYLLKPPFELSPELFSQHVFIQNVVRQLSGVRTFVTAGLLKPSLRPASPSIRTPVYTDELALFHWDNSRGTYIF
jgi:Replication protein